MWPTPYPAHYDEEFVCPGTDCDNCTFECYYREDEE